MALPVWTMRRVYARCSIPRSRTNDSRFWRDLGYALGSLAGLAADASSAEVGEEQSMLLLVSADLVHLYYWRILGGNPDNLLLLKPPFITLPQSAHGINRLDLLKVKRQKAQQ